MSEVINSNANDEFNIKTLGSVINKSEETDKELIYTTTTIGSDIGIIGKSAIALNQTDASDVEEETTTPVVTSIGGIKNDSAKPQISLVPMQMVIDAAKARAYGNEKYKNTPGYSKNNWATLDKQRVLDALMRHLIAYIENPNAKDEESGLSPLCHVAANLSFLCEFEREDWEEQKKSIIERDPILKEANTNECG